MRRPLIVLLMLFLGTVHVPGVGAEDAPTGTAVTCRAPHTSVGLPEGVAVDTVASRVECAPDSGRSPSVLRLDTPIVGNEAVMAARRSDTGSAFGRFIRDVGGDYKHFFSRETAEWYIGGLAAAGVTHLADEEIREALEDPPSATVTALEGGDHYGNLTYQVPLAAAWWIIGHTKGSARAADAGRDLVRAQISATSWAYVWKYAVDRTRPNGDPRSFPSGHSTAVFATAMVLQEHYGWKVGVPFFAGAAYTAASRISVNKHWASDVVFGAAVGVASARTVTLHLRNNRFALRPLVVRGGGGIALARINDR